MCAQYLRTSDIARAVGVHANTVRLYEQWGLLPPVARSPSGYRLFTKAHLDQMRLARTALVYPYPGGKQIVVELVKHTAAGDFASALECARIYATRVRGERAHAEAAAAFLEEWARGAQTERTSKLLPIGKAAKRLDLSADVLRNWERNGLIKTPRDLHSGYRIYAANEIGRLRVIRVLIRAGYSTLAILRMLRQFDRGARKGLRRALDTPPPDEDIVYISDHWLSTLAEQEQRVREMIRQIKKMKRKTCED